jgi:16S rRNA processing protein RimM
VPKTPGPSTVVLGKIVGVFGVRGWVRVLSETDPPEHILTYSPWTIGGEASTWRVREGQAHGKGLIVALDGCDDRDQAAALVGQEISVARDRLPPAGADEIYWIDLEGLAVVTDGGVVLGTIDHLFATAANDVIVVAGERERLLPFVWGDVVKDIDLEAGRMLVDWDPAF